MRDQRDAARQALACLDLTRLGDADTDADIAALCDRALAVAARHGPPAALCVWPAFAAAARRRLPASIAVAAVANFPHGNDDAAQAADDARRIVDAGAQEVDVVLPWRALRAGDTATPARLLEAVRRACTGLRLKVILESGELPTTALVADASRIALDAGADFIKTSTGKTPHGASPAAARTMLQAIAAHPRAAATAGFKASGGVRTVSDAAIYIACVAEALGPAAVGPARLRIGASGLLDDIEAVLDAAARGDAVPPAGAHRPGDNLY